MANATCSIEGCERPHNAKGFCQMHYLRWRSTGDPGPADSTLGKSKGRTCEVDGCDKPMRSKGLCAMHGQRLRVHGTTDDLGPTEAERFWAKVDKSGDCWLWTSALNNTGYGQFRSAGRLVLAHRWSYESANGPVPNGLVLDHLCRTPACVNPGHLEPVTQDENMRRARRDGCRRGHPWPEHAYIDPKGRRWCRTCNNNLRRDRRRQPKEKPP